MKANNFFMKSSKVLNAINLDTMLNLDCDNGVCDFSTPIAKFIKAQGRTRNLVMLRSDFLRGFMGCVNILVINGWNVENQLT
jgi:hypothetical protein